MDYNTQMSQEEIEDAIGELWVVGRCVYTVRYELFVRFSFGVWRCQTFMSLKSGSCSVERANSHMKHIMNPKRAALDIKRVNRDMNIHLNLRTLRLLKRTSNGSHAGNRVKKI